MQRTLIRHPLFVLMLLAPFAASRAELLHTNLPADAKTLNPIQNSELISGDVIKHMYESLTTLDGDGNVIAGLAISWETSSDGMSASFTLREGVRFHSGRELTADDVKWTFEQALTPEKQGGLVIDSLRTIKGADEMLSGLATRLAGFQKIGRYQFQVNFATPTVIFPLYELMIVDSGIEKDHGTDWSLRASAGTGPYRFASWERSVGISLTAFSDYWGGGPQIDGVNFLVVPNIETALSMYEAGELNLVTVPEAAARNVRRDPRFAGQLVEKAIAQVSYLALNQERYAPFTDRRVREAIAISLDREAMVYGLYGGAAVPLHSQITPGFPGYDDAVSEITYDPDRARELLAEAGYPGGVGMPPLEVQATHQQKTLLAFYADHFTKSLGIPVTVRVVERGTHLRELNAGAVAMFPWGWTADYADPSTYLRDLYHSDSSWNRSRYKNPRFDALIDEATRTGNDAARLNLYQQADRLLMEDFGVVPTVVRVQIVIVHPAVRGVQLTAMGYLPFANVMIQ